MSDFLLEIGVEEIPDWMIEPALADLKGRFVKLIETAGLPGQINWVDATPRRLVLLADLAEMQPDSYESVTGPAISAPEGARQGFAKKHGATVEQLGVFESDKGSYWRLEKRVTGRPAAEILSEAIPSIITSLAFPKAMYWTGKGGVRFIRPIRWIVALFGSAVVPFEIAGVQSGNTTRGHRILGSKDPLTVTISSYEAVLRVNYVLVKSAERRARIESGLGPDVQSDTDLLTTLVYLTEWPTAIRGTFDSSYLELPKEILSTVMRHHQRYFTVLKPDGSLAPEFVAITNTDGDPDSLIRQGNESVLRARFNDARFFWKVDQLKKLVDRVEDLKKVTFQAKLEKPTYFDKTERIVALAGELAATVGITADQTAIARAALLSKTDLTTEMVKEFTELQGIVGGLYARAQSEPESVATAIHYHYKPVSMEDSIPSTVEGQIVAVADKLDTLRESFAIGLMPSGSKDPLALRRAAQGLIKILVEGGLPIKLTSYLGGNHDLKTFLDERIAHYFREVKGFAYDEVAAVLAAPNLNISGLQETLSAVRAVRNSSDFEPLAASFKRIKNILKQANQLDSNGQPDPALFTAGPEQDLAAAANRVAKTIDATPGVKQQLEAIASLRPTVDTFFDKILVNDPDEKIRQNRLALLSSLLTEFSRIADFSEIVPRASETT